MSSHRVKSNPHKELPKKELEDEPIAFLDVDRINKIRSEVVNADPEERGLAFVSDHVVRAMVHMAALGLADRVIAKNLGVPYQRVRMTLNSNSVKNEIERLQMDYFRKDSETMFKRLVPAAVQTIFGIMAKRASKDSNRLDAAKYLVDRALGKPKETIEQKTDILSQVYAAIQNPEKFASQSDPIDAEFESVEEIDSQAPSASATDPLEKLFSETDTNSGGEKT